MSEQTGTNDPTSSTDGGDGEAVWAGSSQDGRASQATQDSPAMSQHPAGVAEKIDGIVAQTRADAAGHETYDVRHVLAERFAQAGIEVDEVDFDGLVARASG